MHLRQLPYTGRGANSGRGLRGFYRITDRTTSRRHLFLAALRNNDVLRPRDTYDLIRGTGSTIHTPIHASYLGMPLL
jgi:hypothetical protein